MGLTKSEIEKTINEINEERNNLLQLNDTQVLIENLNLLRNNSSEMTSKIIERVMDLSDEQRNQLIYHSFPKIQMSFPNFYEKQIIEALYKLLYTHEDIQNHQATYLPIMDKLKDALEYIKLHQKNWFISLFQDKKEKDQLKTSQSYFESNQHHISDLTEIIKDLNNRQIDSTIALNDFNQKQAEYYHLMATTINYETGSSDYLMELLTKSLDSLKEKIAYSNQEKLASNIRDKWIKYKKRKAEMEINQLSISYLLTSLDTDFPVDFLYSNEVSTIRDLKALLNYNRNSTSLDANKYEQLSLLLAKFINQYNDSYYPSLSPSPSNEEVEPLLKDIYRYKELQGTDFQSVKEVSKSFDSFTNQKKHYLQLRKNNYTQCLLNQFDYERANNLRGELLDLWLFLKESESLLPRAKTIPIQQVKDDYRVDPASYNAVIDRLTGEQNTYRPNDLPNFVVDKVNSQKLNTNHLRVTLRPYQEFGSKYALTFKKTLLGDEMGLGKTIQAITTLNHLHQNNKKHSVIMMPFSLLTNWRREISKWSSLETYIYHGPNRKRAFISWRETGGCLLLNYEQSHHLRNHLDNQSVDCLVVDEAHLIKNPGTKRTQNANAIAKMAEYNLFMTGTPLENRLNEMEQLMSVLNPKLARNLELNNVRYNIDKFKKDISLVYLRRKRDEVLKELPNIETVEMWSKFSDEEQKYYDEAVLMGISGMQKMRRAGYYGKSPTKSEKIKQIVDICDEAKNNGDKVIIFSFFKIVLNELMTHLQDKTVGMISGDVSADKRQELIDQFTKNMNQNVIMSQIDSGGVGLNIQAANIVILCEPQWKPSTENQAIGRVYRMGQTKNVIVYRLLTEESIDESILKLLGQKEDIFNKYAHDSAVSDAFDHRFKNKTEESEKKLKTQVMELELERVKARIKAV